MTRSSRTLNDTITVYNYTGMDAEGAAQYTHAILRNVYVSKVRGVKKSAGVSAGGGATPADTVTAFFFVYRSNAKDKNGDALEYTTPEAWDAGDRTGKWTLREDGEDLLVLGELVPEEYESTKPPSGAACYSIRTFRDNSNIGSKRIRHYLFEAR